MATKVGGFPSNSQSHLENIKATGSQIPSHFGNNCSKIGGFLFLFCLLVPLQTPSLTLSVWAGFVGGWMVGLRGWAHSTTSVGGWSDQKHTEVRERKREKESKQAVQSWSWAQCRGGGMCQQRTPPTLSILRACGVSLVNVVSAGVGDVGREREKQLEEWMEEESEKDCLYYRATSRGGVRGESLDWKCR